MPKWTNSEALCHRLLQHRLRRLDLLVGWISVLAQHGLTLRAATRECRCAISERARHPKSASLVVGFHFNFLSSSKNSDDSPLCHSKKTTVLARMAPNFARAATVVFSWPSSASALDLDQDHRTVRPLKPPPETSTTPPAPPSPFFGIAPSLPPPPRHATESLR